MRSACWPPRGRAWLKAGATGFALCLGACAIANTPQPDLAYARWAKCNSSSIPVELERVDLDGQITFRFQSEGPRGLAMPRRGWPHGAAASRTCGRLPPPKGP